MLESRLARLAKRDSDRIALAKRKTGRCSLAKRNSDHSALAKRKNDKSSLAKRKTDKSSLAKRKTGMGLPRQNAKASEACWLARGKRTKVRKVVELWVFGDEERIMVWYQ